MDWYALFVKTGKENDVQKWLQFAFNESVLHCIVPKRKLTERKNGKVYSVIRTLFSGYVLINTEMNNIIYKKIVDIPNCINILGNGTYYTKIDQQEISTILSLTRDTEVLDCSKIYIENSKIIVKSGPLRGMEGIIRKIDTRKNRAKVSINFMNCEKMVDLGIELITQNL